MKAVIFNSGLGKRMGELTKSCHKSMVLLNNGETIFERQIRILMESGINEFVVTVGPFKEQLIEASKKFNAKFTFVENPIYDKTNYIYSMFLAKDYLKDDVLLLHGDLVFDLGLVQDMLNDDKSLCLINENKRLPEKDFKGRVINGLLKEVGINIFDDNCYAFQPLYKLNKEDLSKWLQQVEIFVSEGNTGVYAENALNTILKDLNLHAKSYKDNYIDEIDNLEDYTRVREEIDSFENLRGNYEKTKYHL